MCVRFSRAETLNKIAEKFEAKQPSFNCKPSYNVSPSQMCPVICSDGFKLLQWGFISAWSAAHIETTEKEVGFINARAEGIASRPMFRNAFYRMRCIIPVDGFYEWETSAGRKTPYRIERHDKELFGMAGVYEVKTNTFAVITTVANALIRRIHNRMPVILEKKDYSVWLDPKFKNSELLLPLLRAYDSSLLHVYKISDYINDIQNDSIDCIKPAVG